MVSQERSRALGAFRAVSVYGFGLFRVYGWASQSPGLLDFGFGLFKVYGL